MAIFEMRSIDGKSKPFNLDTNKQYESKSQAASVIYREVHSDDSITKKRAAFLRRVIAELDMSIAGGSTYHHNKQKAERGENEYAFNIATNKKAALRKQAEKVAQAEEISHERWQVVMKDTRAIVNSFKGRVAAQAFNKSQKAAGVKTVMVDSQKAA